ncbi:MAG: hypothetical protein GWP08_08055 [Nitrospiraceae bacterium]|nr:hypothetical protein [Nitrospiraceae bacterium]
MNVEIHAENRAWAFRALDDLQAFLDNADFEGDAGEELPVLEDKRTELEEGKYRVVFLGAFNVGKSALINAFLGDAYLPTVLEECTTRITHVVKADETKIVLRLTEDVSDAEVEALTRLIDTCGVTANIWPGEDRGEVMMAYPNSAPRDVLKSLQALVTMNADEDFPQLKSLRGKLDEILLQVPTDLLEDDIAFVDTPGVHSISETGDKIAQSVIPNSHLVVYLIDSQSAGNQQSRDFVEGVVKARNRKVFFVINKSDQLNPEEIDLTGRRGPAKDLLRSLSGIVDEPELFFVSSLYALIAAQLGQGAIALDDLDANNKIKIPFGVQRDLLKSENPEQGFADHLLEQSNLTALKDRLLDYLYRENREGAIVESVCRFIGDRAWAYARPMEIKLEMARDHPRLAELKRERQRVARELDQNKSKAEQVGERYTAATEGEAGSEVPGYQAFVDAQLANDVIEEEVLKPLRDWMDNAENFRKAKKSAYDTLTTELENTIDAYVRRLHATINSHVGEVESDAVATMGHVAGAVDTRPAGPIESTRAAIGVVRAGLAGSYFAFAGIGATWGSAIGGATWYGLTQWAHLPVDTAIADAVARWTQIDIAGQQGAGMGLCMAGGAILATIIGVCIRAATAKKALRRKLDNLVARKARAILLRGVSGAKTVAAVKTQLADALETRRTQFREYVEAAFEQNVADLNDEMTAITDEEEAVRGEQAAVIARLEPKVEGLTAIRQKAHDIVEATS